MVVKKKSKEPQLIKLSASSVKTYDQCPKKYFFNYIERAPKKDWVHFDLGNLCHKALEIFHQVNMKKPVPKKEWNKLMGKCFGKARKKYPRLNDDLLKEAKDLLKDYLTALKKSGMPNVQGVETDFSFNITDDVLIRGFLDRYDVMKDGRFHIIDYKTTKSVQYLDEEQLLIYGLWLRKQHPDIESFRGSYLLLRHDSNLKSYDFTIEDVDKIEKKLINYASKIRDDDVWVPVPTRLCNWCDFKDICPAQKAW